jgi:signal peptidase I
MNFRMIVLFLVVTTAMTILNGCTDSITDTATEKKIKVVQNPDPSLTKVKVETDGMLSDLGYGQYHPFGMGNEVFIDSKYYDKNKISRGDIVLFKTKHNPSQNSDIARIVGLPGETINIKKGQVYINGNKLDTFYGNDSSIKNNDSMKQPLTLNENEYFILADVRWRGFNDSQTVNAAFSQEEILGKVIGYENKIKIENEIRKVTTKQLRQITKDMTYQEVVNLLGNTKDIGSGRYIISYEYENGKRFNFNFGGYNEIINDQSYLTIQNLLSGN